MNPSQIASPSIRRDFLRDAVFGLGGVALCQLLSADQLLASAPASRPRPHHQPRAERVIHVFLGGGLSHVDSFDPKPALLLNHGQPLPDSFRPDAFFGKVGQLHRPHFAFRPRGKSGLEISDLFPHLAGVADELTLVRSMVAETANHIPGIFQANTGFRSMGFPAMGAWLSYGLGSMADDLPSFVVLADARGLPVSAGGAFNWSSGFLPATHQGVAFAGKGAEPVPDLHGAEPRLSPGSRDRARLLESMNLRHAANLDPGLTDPLVARIRAYELAARMQGSIPSAVDLGSEPESMRKLYGLDRSECADAARNCMIARRLIERGVRMVQIWTGDGISWDSHDDVTGKGYKGHTGEALRIDRPLAGMIRDLRQRGLLDTTLVLITTEFGRTPYAQSAGGTPGKGRDHHPQAFTNLLCGGGSRGGYAHGATDEIGYHAVEKKVTIPDFHATVLHLLGLDHEQLTFYHGGIQRRLTNVHGRVIRDLLA